MTSSARKDSHKYIKIASQQLQYSLDTSLNYSSVKKRDSTFDSDISYFKQMNPGESYLRKTQLSSLNKLQGNPNMSGFESDTINTSFNLININQLELTPIKRQNLPPRIITQRNTVRISQNNTIRVSNKIHLDDEISNNNKIQQIQNKSASIQSNSTQGSNSTTNSSIQSSNSSNKGNNSTIAQTQVCIIPKDKISFVSNNQQGMSLADPKNQTQTNNKTNHFSLIRRKKKKSLSTSVSCRPSSSEQLMHKQLLLDNPAPFVSAQSWAMLDKTTGELIFGRNEQESRQVASLTKIMTTYVVLDLINRYKINEHQTYVKILPSSAKLIGTSACLIENDKLSIWELLHGMMLPSGNDAAQSLAIHFGIFCLKEEYKIHKTQEAVDEDKAEILKLTYDNFECLEGKPQLINKALNQFYKQMNREALYLNLKNTNFSSAHGMYHEQNFSSAQDIAKLSYFAMKNSLFRQIVKTQKYTCESKVEIGHLYQWQNTNKLLEMGYSGLKTGITPTAGPCLAASIVKNEFKFIIVILNSRSMEHRWVEVQKLVHWAMQKITKIKQSDLKPKMKRKLLKKLLHL